MGGLDKKIGCQDLRRWSKRVAKGVSWVRLAKICCVYIRFLQWKSLFWIESLTLVPVWFSLSGNALRLCLHKKSHNIEIKMQLHLLCIIEEILLYQHGRTLAQLVFECMRGCVISPFGLRCILKWEKGEPLLLAPQPSTHSKSSGVSPGAPEVPLVYHWLSLAPPPGGPSPPAPGLHLGTFVIRISPKWPQKTFLENSMIQELHKQA